MNKNSGQNSVREMANETAKPEQGLANKVVTIKQFHGASRQTLQDMNDEGIETHHHENEYDM